MMRFLQKGVDAARWKLKTMNDLEEYFFRIVAGTFWVEIRTSLDTVYLKVICSFKQRQRINV